MESIYLYFKSSIKNVILKAAWYSILYDIKMHKYVNLIKHTIIVYISYFHCLLI